MILLILGLLGGAGYFGYNIDKRINNLESRYGGKEKLSCKESDLEKLLQNRIVRVIGTWGEGSGFPVTEDLIITNFHVIEGETSPKVVFSDGSFATPVSITGNKTKDIAVIKLDKKLKPLPFYGFLGTTKSFPETNFGEPVYVGGYPFGSTLPGRVSINKGFFGGKRYAKEFDMSLLQTDISVNQGMSGGPLVDQCGNVLGVTTAGVAGLSVYLDMTSVQSSWGDLSKKEVARIEIDLSSPDGVIKAFYTYIKARNLKLAYDLLSEGRRLEKDFVNWEKGYAQTLQVDLVKVEKEVKNEGYAVKLVSSDWVDGELIRKFYEGTWDTVKEGTAIKLGSSNIKEISEPGWEWFY